MSLVRAATKSSSLSAGVQVRPPGVADQQRGLVVEELPEEHLSLQIRIAGRA
jgi:hypothetical protein